MRRSTTKRGQTSRCELSGRDRGIGVDVQYLLTGRTSDPGTLALTRDEELLLAGFRELKLRENAGCWRWWLRSMARQWNNRGRKGAG